MRMDVSSELGSSPRGRGKRRCRWIRRVGLRLIPARAGKTMRDTTYAHVTRAHPRAGGENPNTERLRQWVFGSSPRGRGKLLLSLDVHVCCGLIPARAGKTSAALILSRRRAAHPRAGGENPATTGLTIGFTGSSPRGRGKQTKEYLELSNQGLIPARAGKTSRLTDRAATWAAHPRAGGENEGTCPFALRHLGSSPRGRGKPFLFTIKLTVAGLIPARAGKTTSLSASPTTRRAHPRAGGENGPTSYAGSLTAGSSPRGRGKHRPYWTPARRKGLIPARAGKTVIKNVCPGRAWAHPRAGGENAPAGATVTATYGSSPRGRGKRVPLARKANHLGLIPARAGKTATCLPAFPASTAHPRAGGENCYNTNGNRGVTGSSPRGRGKHHGGRPRAQGRRLIPARAGKTPGNLLRENTPKAHPRAGGENVMNCFRASLSAGSSPRGRGKPELAHPGPVDERLIPARAGKTTRGQGRPPCPPAHPRAGGEN